MVDDETRQRVLDAVEHRWPHADLSHGSPAREQIKLIMIVVEAMEGED